MKKNKDNFPEMTTREAVLFYGLSFSDTYQDAPFHDENWQLVRLRKNKNSIYSMKEEMRQSRCISFCHSLFCLKQTIIHGTEVSFYIFTVQIFISII